MLELGKEFGITYSYFCIMNYEDIELLPEHLQSGGDLSDLAPHFDWTEAAEIADSGELGLHGFSHRPLLLEYWKSAADMQRTVAVCRRIWTDRHDAPLPTSFVPPNNEYDQCCTQALTEYFPEITAICSTYGHGQFSRGGDREFGPEPWAPGLFAIPRSTSGMEMIAENRLEMVSQLETMGVWTHFVHPDNSFDTPQSHPDETSWRNPLSRSWRATNQDGQAGLLHAFRDWLSFVKQHFPWLRFVSTCDAVSLLRSHLNLNFQVRYGENRILIASQPGIYFRLRSNAPSRINPAGISNAELIDIDEHDRFAVYTFRSTAAEVELDLI